MPLDPEVAALLERQKNLPPRSSLDVAATREMMRRGASLTGTPPPLPRIEDVVLSDALRVRDYWPALESDLPLVIYFHGGRFFSGDLESHDTLCRKLALSGGCRIVAVDYRLGPEHRFPAAVEDACLAVDWALAQGVPTGVAGDSAGANLATVAAIARKGSALSCQLLVYPMIDATCSLPSYMEFAESFGPGAVDMRRGWHEYLPEGADPRDPRASPLFAADLSGLAPALVITAECDTLRDEGEMYSRRLVEAGTPAELRRYDGVIHGFFAMPGVLGAARAAIDEAGAFLRRSLKQE
jgi:acetyl esterase